MGKPVISYAKEVLKNLVKYISKKDVEMLELWTV